LRQDIAPEALHGLHRRLYCHAGPLAAHDDLFYAYGTIPGHFGGTPRRAAEDKPAGQHLRKWHIDAVGLWQQAIMPQRLWNRSYARRCTQGISWSWTTCALTKSPAARTPSRAVGRVFSKLQWILYQNLKALYDMQASQGEAKGHYP
jgi:hypothetical protein